MVSMAPLFRQHIVDLSHRCVCFPGSWLAGENMMVFPQPHRVLLALEVARKSALFPRIVECTLSCNRPKGKKAK